MITDTTAAPVFIDWQPDWGQPVGVLTGWKTSITVNREGGEQRSRLRKAPRLTISYKTGVLTTMNFAKRRAAAMAQMRAAVVIPVWVEYKTASAFATNSVTANSAITSLKFKNGSWVYVLQGGVGCFRKITSVATPVINLSSDGDDFYPVGFSWAGFSAGARVYPCIVGMRAGNAMQFQLPAADRKDDAIEIEEL